MEFLTFTGETVYAAASKKTSSAGASTLSRRTRRGHGSALSSSSTASDRSESVYPDEHGRLHLSNGKSQFYSGIIRLALKLKNNQEDEHISGG